MQLAPRGNDAAAITAKYEIPTMQATDCVVCHKVIDPVAGLFQDYYALDGKGVYLRRKDGWYRDMFSPGHEGETLPDEERWRALQWLGERTAKDPRFAIEAEGEDEKMFQKLVVFKSVWGDLTETNRSTIWTYFKQLLIIGAKANKHPDLAPRCEHILARAVELHRGA